MYAIDRWMDNLRKQQDIEGEIRKLRHQQSRLDYDLKEELVRSGNFDMLMVNKGLIRRIYYHQHKNEPKAPKE